MAASSSRAATVVKVSLDLSEAEVAMLQPQVGAAVSLASTLVARPRVPNWATEEEAEAMRRWLASVAEELNEPGLASSLASDAHELSATWQWPASPLIDVRLDSEPVAVADYLPASASAHWFLRWIAETPRARPIAELPIMSLAGHTPEEAEEDETMLTAVLDAAVAAAITQLTGRGVDGELHDV